VALPFCDRVFRWDQVFETLEPLEKADRNVAAFLEFLDKQGLGPQEPLSLDQIAAYVIAARVPQDCYVLASRLASQACSWDFLPAGLGVAENRNVKDLRWGRVGIEFYFEYWKPGIFAGFLLEGSDHRLALVDQTKGIDLVMMIESENPATRISGDAVELAVQRIRALNTNTVAWHQYELKSRWRKLVLQSSLADVIASRKTEEQQVHAIYERFSEWGHVLFDDGTLESAFRETWPEDFPQKSKPRK
jgi:hypothetical protein